MSSMNEFCIEWTKDRDYATVTALSGTALKSKLIALAEKRPEEVKRVFENVDGSVLYHVPVKYIKVSPPKKVSEEQKNQAAERFKKMWEERRIGDDPEDDGGEL